MRDVLHLNDIIVDFSITSNRPDCQSMLGIAREVAVVLGQEFRAPVPTYATAGGDIHDHIAIEVKDYDLCPRYMGRIVRNLRIAPSPDWMKDCLKAAGMRPINNIVDITNFVMLETGHPMHAFDLRDIAGNQIIVRRAAEGEPITTLDGKDHTLTPDMLVIADAKAPSCLAGIMGGLNSEIKTKPPICCSSVPNSAAIACVVRRAPSVCAPNRLPVLKKAWTRAAPNTQWTVRCNSLLSSTPATSLTA
jgi:phenylalanyl-tRNA synthetase beta chain